MATIILPGCSLVEEMCALAIGGMETTRVVAISFSLCNKSTSPSKGQADSKRADDGLFLFTPGNKEAHPIKSELP